MASTSVRGQSASLWWKSGFVFLVVVSAGLVIGSQDNGELAAREEGKADKTALPADLELVSPDVAFVASFRVVDIWNCDAVKELRRLKKHAEIAQLLTQFLGVAPADIERLTLVVTTPKAQPLVFIATTKAYDRAKVLKTGFQGAKEKKVKDKALFVAAEGNAVHFVSDRVYVTGVSHEMSEWLQGPAPKKAGPLSAALLTAAAKHVLVAAVNPAAIPEEDIRKVPDEFKSFLAIKSAVLTVDVGEAVKAELTAVFPTEDDAAAGETNCQTGLTAIRGFLEESSKTLTKEGKENAKFVEFLRKVEGGLKTTAVEKKGTTVRAAVSIKIESALLGVGVAQAVERVRESAARVNSINNLRQLTLGIISYADAHCGRLPAAAIFDKNGKPLLSWRVEILPYIEHQALYKEFHLDEPWDSAHNKKLLAKMPKVFAPVLNVTKEKYVTFYQGFYGKDAAWEGTMGLKYPADIPDGTSNTILLAEAAKPVPWSKPVEIPFGPGKLWPLVGGQFKSGFCASLCDGSARFCTKKLTEATFRAAITRNGNDILGEDW
jgi:hypothetical protein